MQNKKKCTSVNKSSKLALPLIIAVTDLMILQRNDLPQE